MDDSVMGAFQQADRLIEIETPLGKDVLLIERFSGREGINSLFEFKVAVRSKKDDIAASDIVGKNVTVSLELGEGKKRLWNALVTSLEEEPRITRGFRSYALTLRPDLWLLSQRSDCRIWQQKTTMDVANTLMSEHGLKAPEIHLQYPPQPKLFSVQWNETDLDYLLRRFEEDGLFYFIRQKDGEQKLVIADHQVYWDKGADGGTGRERLAAGSSDRNHITSWKRKFDFTPGKRAGRDYNFETPKSIPGNDSTSNVKLPRNGSYELYEYPTRALTNDAAQKAMALRMKAVEGGHQTIEATSTVRTLAPGAKLTPYNVADPSDKHDTTVVVEIEHEATGPTYETNSGSQPSYSNRFTAMPADRPATPHRETPRPRIDGSQLATIAGPPGEEIYTDEFGRVRLWFFWDRKAKRDGTDTPWIRVAQPWAGGTWGSQVIPRIGMEAIVTFEGGDPDRPIVTALVPNPIQKVPYALPANKSRMVFRSNTHKGSGFNEFSMEDSAGGENMFFHAQKDHTTRVLNDQTARTDRHQVQSVGGNRSVEVAKNQKHEVGGSYNLVVGGTGAGALGAMAKVAGLAGQTASLLQQAGALAGGGGAELGSFAASMASSSLGFLSGGGLAARQGVVAGPSPRADAGTALAAAGTGMGQDVGGLFSLPGVMNTIAGAFKSDTVGVAGVEQFGMSKVTNVGTSHVVNVGKAQDVTVGETATVNVGTQFQINVGNKDTGLMASLTMKNDGTIVLYAKNSISIKPVELLAGESKQIQFDASSLFYAHSDGALLHDAKGNIADTAPTISLTASKEVLLEGGPHVGINDSKGK